MKTKKTLRAEAIVRRSFDLDYYNAGGEPRRSRSLKTSAEKARIAARDIANTRAKLAAN